MVGVGVFPIGGEQEPRPGFSERRRKRPAMFQGRFEVAVGQPQIRPPRASKRLVRGDGFARARFQTAERRRLAGREVEDADLPAGPQQRNDRPSHPQLRVIRVRGDHQGVKHETLGKITIRHKITEDTKKNNH